MYTSGDGGLIIQSMALTDLNSGPEKPWDQDIIQPYTEYLGTVEHYIHLVRGLGFQKKMEHKLEQAQRQQRAFARAQASRTITSGSTSGTGTPPLVQLACDAAQQQHVPQQGSLRGPRFPPQTTRGGSNGSSNSFGAVSGGQRFQLSSTATAFTPPRQSTMARASWATPDGHSSTAAVQVPVMSLTPQPMRRHAGGRQPFPMPGLATPEPSQRRRPPHATAEGY
jgi:hypothetical protein